MLTILKHNWRTQDRDIREYIDCVITHFHITILLIIHFHNYSRFISNFLSLLFFFIIWYSPPRLSTTEGMTSLCCANTNGKWLWMLTGLQHSWLRTSTSYTTPLPLSWNCHKAAGFRRSHSRGLESLGAPFSFKYGLLVYIWPFLIILTYSISYEQSPFGPDDMRACVYLRNIIESFIFKGPYVQKSSLF